jgi:hypothetical protein
LREFSNGGLRVETKVGAGVIACLYTLRQVALEEQVDFDSAARVYGEQVLRGRCGSDVSAATIDALVAAVIDILGKVVRSKAN